MIGKRTYLLVSAHWLGKKYSFYFSVNIEVTSSNITVPTERIHIIQKTNKKNHIENCVWRNLKWQFSLLLGLRALSTALIPFSGRYFSNLSLKNTSDGNSRVSLASCMSTSPSLQKEIFSLLPNLNFLSGFKPNYT